MPAFRAPPGFIVERVAGPPLVRYPLFAEFDDRGRLFVAEGTGANLSGEELRARKLGRIVETSRKSTQDLFRRSVHNWVFPRYI